jgi:hypothetical protein
MHRDGGLMAVLRISTPRLGDYGVVAGEVIDAQTFKSTPVELTAGRVSQVDVDAGTHLVRATLPDGQTMSRTIVVGGGDESSVTLVAPERYRSDRVTTVRDLLDDPATAMGRSGIVAAVGGWVLRLASPLLRRFPDVVVALPVPRRTRPGRPEPDAANHDDELTFGMHEVDLRLWAGRSESTALRSGALHSSSKMIEWVVKEGSNTSTLQVSAPNCASRAVVIPPGRPLTIRVTRLDVRSGFDDGLGIEVFHTNPRVQALVDYLSVGRIEQAQRVAEPVLAEAREMFRNKLSDPGAAVVAGYYMLAQGREADLANWPANFANWFEELPDALVIHAGQLLRVPGVPDRETALRRLVDAAHRDTLPSYTAGVRILYDGLRAFVGSDYSDEAGAALEHVRPFADACDWSKPITTYWATDPATPTLERYLASNVARVGTETNEAARRERPSADA